VGQTSVEVTNLNFGVRREAIAQEDVYACLDHLPPSLIADTAPRIFKPSCCRFARAD
jgi:hypothetical protein